MSSSLLIFIIFFLFLVFITGLCIGSFLNVVISRAFSNESIVFPGSKCPKCQKSLKWYHNIPLLSYLFLRGKCAFCKEHISIQYPIVEFITGILFIAVYIKFGISINTIFMLIFASIFVVLAATDLKEKVVFDAHTYTLLGFGLVYNMFNFGHLYSGAVGFRVFGHALMIQNSFIAAIFGIILGIALMEAFARLGYILAGTRAFGEGDTYIAAALGAVFGWKYLITILIYSFIIQVIFTLPVFIKKLINAKDYRTLTSFFLFIAVVCIIKINEYFSISNSVFVTLFLTILLCGVGIYVCKRVLSGIKNPSNMTFLPFGPAMVLAGLITIIFVI